MLDAKHKGSYSWATNKLDQKARAQILTLLCEGMSIRAITRLTGASKNTVAKLLVNAGHACAAYQDRVLRNLPSKRVRVDEIWSVVYAKAANVRHAKSAPMDSGDIWTWTAICADTKLLASFYVGDRTYASARPFMDDLKDRLANRVQLTSDGHRAYIVAVEQACGDDVDYAMLQKLYGTALGGEVRYSPAVCTGTRTRIVTGDPDEKCISTSYAGRANLTMRMHMRCFTRLTNAFSKKIENHACAIALHAMFYNFVRIHQTVKVSPAMAAGVTDRLWEMSDVVEMIEAFETSRLRAAA
jgi:IS1 family transposase